jgi:glycosyltransferase involved in cell wall biosynthesis
MENPLVSVNIATYNRAPLLARCLDSVLAQNYENMEIIVVNDASSDNTVEVVEEYQQNDSRIELINHEENKGLSATRNTAYRISKGSLIAFMDDDDEWTDNQKIKKQVQIFDQSDEDLGIICSGVLLIDHYGEKRKKIIEEPRDLKSHILTRNGIIYSPTVMTRKSIIEKAGGFDDNLSRGVDSDYYRRCIVRHNYKVHFMPEVTTAIHEYGDDRITPFMGFKGRMNIIIANGYLIYKYFDQYLFYPKPLFMRIKTIFRTCIKP